MREPGLFAADHLPCARNVPISVLRAHPEVVLQVTDGRYDAPMLIQCGKLKGTWAAEVKLLLEDRGFSNLVNIGGHTALTKLGCTCPVKEL